MGLFEDILPCTESNWRSIILFGANVASYKFALGKSLLGIAAEEKTFVALEDLAAPFARHVSQHIKAVDKQGQRPSGPFLESCRQFNRGEIDFDRLVLVTQRHGFNNVIDAFHTVNGQQTTQRFFIDDRVSKRGITITDDLLGLRDSLQYGNLEPEHVSAASTCHGLAASYAPKRLVATRRCERLVGTVRAPPLREHPANSRNLRRLSIADTTSARR